MARLTREKAEQLRTLSSQLLLFESRLCKKQKEIEASLSQRESIILRQQKVIRQLQNRLAERSTSIRDSPPCDALDRLDSLGDSDSAVVLEETADDPAPPRYAFLRCSIFYIFHVGTKAFIISSMFIEMVKQRKKYIDTNSNIFELSQRCTSKDLFVLSLGSCSESLRTNPA